MYTHEIFDVKEKNKINALLLPQAANLCSKL